MLQDVPGRGAEGKTDPEFLRALLDEVGDGAENSYGDESDRHGREARYKNQIETCTAERVANAVVRGLDIKDRLVLVQRIGSIANRAEERAARQCGRNDDGC